MKDGEELVNELVEEGERAVSCKCPYCGRMLDHLEMITEEEWARDFRATGVGLERRYLRTVDWYFCCPYCGALLTDCENIAKAILQGTWNWEGD